MRSPPVGRRRRCNSSHPRDDLKVFSLKQVLVGHSSRIVDSCIIDVPLVLRIAAWPLAVAVKLKDQLTYNSTCLKGPPPTFAHDATSQARRSLLLVSLCIGSWKLCKNVQGELLCLLAELEYPLLPKRSAINVLP